MLFGYNGAWNLIVPDIFLSPLPAATRAIRLARRGVSPSFEEPPLGDFEREALVSGIPLWLATKRGWVYLAANESWPGVYKIGCTRKTVPERLAGLSGAGVATPWVPVRSWGAYDAHGLEAQAHSACEPWLYRGELFQAQPDDLAAKVDETIQADRALLQRHLGPLFLPGHLATLLDAASSAPVEDAAAAPYTSVGHP